MTLKERNIENVTPIKQVYNARHRFKLATRTSRIEMQQLQKRLEDNKYVNKFRTVGESTTIQDIFFSLPKFVNLLNTFPTVLLMDSTYKTNSYSMSLLQIVGVTSTEKTYSVGFAFLNFSWALEICHSLFRSEDITLKVIVTDRNTALMNVAAGVFPN
ncbi:protein FAR1-related sequence 5-like, partial [Trifolium pratense]